MENINYALTKIYPNGLTGKEITRRITEIYHAGYDLNNSDFDVYDQLQVCEVLEKTQQEYREKNGDNKRNVSVNGNDNGSYKLCDNFKLIIEKQNIVKKLSELNYKTPIYKLTSLLEQLFLESKSKTGHWTYIAERYTPKTINSVLYNMTKQYGNGWKNLSNPAAYFTSVIKHRPKRIFFRRTNGNHKQNN